MKITRPTTQVAFCLYTAYPAHSSD